MKSFSVFVGTGACNANCEQCAGRPLRCYAPSVDEVTEDYQERLIRAMRYCRAHGATSLSITSSGEPTLSPRSVNRVLYINWDQFQFRSVNLYTNGYRIGTDRQFCEQYLRGWAALGLTSVYVTVHHPNSLLNAHHFGMKEYPSLQLVFDRIHEQGLKVRANLVLTKELYPGPDIFSERVWRLRSMGADMISAWPIRKVDTDEIDMEKAPNPIHVHHEAVRDGARRSLGSADFRQRARAELRE